MPKIFVAIPLQDELENLTVIHQDLVNQTYPNYHVVFCVNQPDSWWSDPEYGEVCKRNALSLNYLHSITEFPVRIIDRSSPGMGWKGLDYGVGWARKLAMDAADSLAAEGDILLMTDGDTRFGPRYLSSIQENLSKHPTAVALSVPYYHKLTSDSTLNRAILRYEIYMRYYVLNLWRIGSPYSFTALGSAIALPVASFRAIGGMTPRKSGEDFYFLQKLRKYGPVLFWNEEEVFPATRYSDRVFFGTGPALIKGRMGDWSSYPVYPFHLFDLVKQTTDKFPYLFKSDLNTPMDNFLKSAFKVDDLWGPLRENHPQPQRFIRAAHEKVDGLRILQFLKSSYRSTEKENVKNLLGFLEKFHPDSSRQLTFPFNGRGFNEAGIPELDQLRNYLRDLESQVQKKHHRQFNRKK